MGRKKRQETGEQPGESGKFRYGSLDIALTKIRAAYGTNYVECSSRKSYHKVVHWRVCIEKCKKAKCETYRDVVRVLSEEIKEGVE
jgi:hypothetical protein